jgi:glycosyltransferase involved in cell wall biosynthesis
LSFLPCILIPCYNHGGTMDATLRRASSHGLPIVVVDDGSEPQCQAILQGLAEQYAEQVSLLRLPQNGGKGAAVCRGLRYAAEQGYSHAIQVDADGQHSIEDISVILDISKAAPEAVVSGVPIYDQSVPMGRLLGRYITHFWVWVHTLSFKIADSMCGFRVYPLAATEQLLDSRDISLRMDFDIEIIVRLFWQGCPIINFPTRVTYPEEGVSHFEMLADNLRISRVHTRLFFGMLLRLPWLLPLRLIGKR